MSPRLQIFLFILFAAGLFLFIRVFSSSSAPKEPEQKTAVVGQMTLPTQAESGNSELSKFTSKSGTFSFEYPSSWSATESALLVPDPTLGTPSDAANFFSPDGKNGVLAEVLPNRNRLTTATLFGCAVPAKKCIFNTVRDVPYVQFTDARGVVWFGAVVENTIYVLQVLGPADSIIGSVSL